jgi:hypothetical protein
MLKTDPSDRSLPIQAVAPASPLPLWEWNRRVGWVSTCLGAASGLILGLWSFDGPVPVPEWLGPYDDTARRLARLGHIAFFGLGILNLLMVSELRRRQLTPWNQRLASWAMNFGNIGLPLTLFAAAAYRPCKYFMSAPATAVFVALVLTAYGVCYAKASSPSGGPGNDSTA